MNKLSGLIILTVFLLFPSARAQTLNLEPVLETFAGYLEGVQAGIRSELATLAESPEAKSGDWGAIEPRLLEASQRAPAPGAWFYILPDGSYYRAGEGLTGISLADRPYFEGLFDDNPVAGFPLESRSTGEKSAFFAVPVKSDDGAVIGAVGMSLFLNSWQSTIGRALKLPAQVTWFVINRDGTTLLDRDAGFIFMSVITDGGPTLRAAITKALAGEAGTISYEIGGKPRVGQYRKLAGIDWWLVAAEVEAGGYTEIHHQLGLRLERVRTSVQAMLNHTDANLIEVLAPFQGREAKVEELTEALDAFAASHDLVREASLIDPGPGAKLPALRRATRLADGSFAAEILQPLRNADGIAYAAARAVIVPGEMIVEASREFLAPGYEIWAIEQDGTHLYDVNEEEIGRNLLTDPLYAGMGSLLEMAERMQDEPEGQGDYIFMSAVSQQKSVKVARWATVELHGRPWRLVMINRPYHD